MSAILSNYLFNFRFSKSSTGRNILIVVWISRKVRHQRQALDRSLPQGIGWILIQFRQLSVSINLMEYLLHKEKDLHQSMANSNRAKCMASTRNSTFKGLRFEPSEKNVSTEPRHYSPSACQSSRWFWISSWDFGLFYSLSNNRLSTIFACASAPINSWISRNMRLNAITLICILLL